VENSLPFIYVLTPFKSYSNFQTGGSTISGMFFWVLLKKFYTNR